MPLTPLLLATLAVQAPETLTLEGRPAPAGALNSAVVLFWRADCGPCLQELADLAALRLAAAPLQVRPVVLEQAPKEIPVVVRALAKVGLARSDSLRSPIDPAKVLTTYGGAPPRLPLAIAFNRAGLVCGRHTGFLGYNQLRAWAVSCGTSNAAR